MTTVTKARATRCTTHHACDCTTYRMQQMKRALDVIHTWASVPNSLDAKRVRELAALALGDSK